MSSLFPNKRFVSGAPLWMGAERGAQRPAGGVGPPQRGGPFVWDRVWLCVFNTCVVDDDASDGVVVECKMIFGQWLDFGFD